MVSFLCVVGLYVYSADVIKHSDDDLSASQPSQLVFIWINCGNSLRVCTLNLTIGNTIYKRGPKISNRLMLTNNAFPLKKFVYVWEVALPPRRNAGPAAWPSTFPSKDRIWFLWAPAVGCTVRNFGLPVPSVRATPPLHWSLRCWLPLVTALWT